METDHEVLTIHLDRKTVAKIGEMLAGDEDCSDFVRAAITEEGRERGTELEVDPTQTGTH